MIITNASLSGLNRLWKKKKETRDNIYIPESNGKKLRLMIHIGMQHRKRLSSKVK